jgi:hypothetical protein
LLIIFVVFLLLLEKKKLLKNEVVDKSEVRLSLKILASIVCVPIVYFFVPLVMHIVFVILLILFVVFLLVLEKKKLLKNDVVDKSEVRLSLNVLTHIVLVPIVYFLVPVVMQTMITRTIMEYILPVYLFNPFVEKVQQSRDFVVEEKYYVKMYKSHCYGYGLNLSDDTGQLILQLCNRHLYDKLKQGSRVQITGFNSSFGFSFKNKDIRVLD